MGKAGKLRKKRRIEQGLSANPYAVFSQDSCLEGVVSSKMDQSVEISDDIGKVTSDELATTLSTLKKLAENPAVLMEKNFKPLRMMIHRFRNDLLIPAGRSLSGKVSDSLQDGKYETAIRNLALMRQRGETPRLGALQRWVRDCDAVGFTDKLIVRTLDAILRTADPLQVAASDCCEEMGEEPLMAHEGRIIRTDEWNPLKDEVAVCKPFPEVSKEIAENSFELIGTEKAEERLPPNKYDCRIYGSKPGAVKMESHPKGVIGIRVPFLRNSLMLQNVLSASECHQILGLANGLGLQPDQPLGFDSNSVLADNVIWCADEDLNETIFKRCSSFLPSDMDGRKISGINRRWRLYRYLPGAEYRPHIDGAWPKSGVENGKYVYDVDGESWSRLTFLIYLNDDFEGGWTTFFTPTQKEGSLEAHPVKPTAGCVMVFPHGDAEGSILHEGSGCHERRQVYYSN